MSRTPGTWPHAGPPIGNERRARHAARMLCLLALLLFALPAAAGTQRGLIWRVNSGPSACWLVGSVHIGRPSMYPLPPSFERALRETDTLVLEADIRPASVASVAGDVIDQGLLPRGKRLSKTLSQSQWQTVASASRAVGMPVALIAHQRAWLAADSLMLATLGQAGWSPMMGVEQRLLDRAPDRPVLVLEGLKSQLALLADLPEKTQRQLLLDIAREHDTLAARTERLVQSWERGDIRAFRRQIREADAGLSSLLQSRLIDDRNAAMARRIMQLIEDGRSHLFVVGAAHLVGSNGVVARLRRHGYDVVQH